MDAIIQGIKDIFGIQGVQFALCLWVVYFLTKHITKIRTEYNGLDTKIDEVEKRLDTKIDEVEKRLDAKIDGVEKRLDAKIDGVEKRLDAKIDEVEKRLDAKIDKVEERVEKRFDKLDMVIDDIRRDMAFLKGSFDISKNKQPELMKSNSPISLTKEGEQVAEEMQAQSLIDRNWDKISKDLAKLANANAYDIQTYCIETASVEPESFFDAQAIDFVKTFAFKNGMPVQLPLRLLGLLIRDRYFAENGMPLKAIDEV